jgi:hypothetical protein
VDFIDNHVTDICQTGHDVVAAPSGGLKPSQQDTSSHKRDFSTLCGLRLSANDITDFLANSGASLFAYAVGKAKGRDPSWLGATRLNQ